MVSQLDISTFKAKHLPIVVIANDNSSKQILIGNFPAIGKKHAEYSNPIAHKRLHGLIHFIFYFLS